MTDLMQAIFSPICGQNPAHTWAPAGDFLPFCQRCTGLYIGAAIALALLLWFRPVPKAGYCWLHGILLLAMAPFGFHLVPHGAVLRTMSGQWFGFGVVGLLWLMPGAKWAPAGNGAAAGSRLHMFLAAASIAALPLLADRGGTPAAVILPLLALGGLAVLAGLVAANLAILLSNFLSWAAPRGGRATP
jgi:uncharacterized membrane protein